MTCLGCNAMEAGPVVTLHDGRVVCNTCDDWRRETEARHLLAMPRDDLQAALAERVKKRGAESVNALRRLMAAIYRQGGKK